MEATKNPQKRKWQEAFQEINPKIIEAKKLLTLVRSQPGIKGNSVLMLTDTDYKSGKVSSPWNVIQQIAAQHKLKSSVQPVKTAVKCKLPTWNLYLGQEILASGEYQNQAKATTDLAAKAVDDLMRHCFTLLKKKQTKSNVNKDGLMEASRSHADQLPKTMSLGASMLAKMGWTGGGLGANEQGIVKNIEVQETVNRRCLGSGNFMENISKILSDFAKTNSLKSLVFSTEYSKSEREQIHTFARRHNLNSKSYGTGPDRYLVVKCRLDPWHILEEIIEAGGETDEYKVIYPTDL